MRNADDELMVRMDFTFHPEMDQESKDWVVSHMATALQSLVENALHNTLNGTAPTCPDCTGLENR